MIFLTGSRKKYVYILSLLFPVTHEYLYTMFLSKRKITRENISGSKNLPFFGEGGYVLILTLSYILSRYLFYLKDGYFTARPLYFAKQYLDPILLENDLLASLFHLHSQPPLFNFFLGIVLKISPEPAITYELLFKTAGLIIPILLFSILSMLGIKRLIAFLITFVFMFNPTLFLYENLLYYTHFEAFFILLSIFFLLRWGLRSNTKDIIFFFLSLLCLGMTRSLFHPFFFFFLVIVFAIFIYKNNKKHLSKVFLYCSLFVLIPFVLICTKNLVVYDFFGTSSWTGMSLWIKANTYLSEQLEELEKKGIVSPLAIKAALDVFRPITNYFDDKELESMGYGHPADSEILKNSRKPNYNHKGFVKLSKQLFRDSFSLIRLDPKAFGFYTLGSYSLTLWHSSDSVHALFEDNMKILNQLEGFYRFLNFGFFGVKSRHSDPRLWVRTVFVSGFFLFFYLLTLINLFKKEGPMPFAIKLICLFCLTIHAYTIAVSSFIEFGENNRFRFPVDSAFLILMMGNISCFFKKPQKKSNPDYL